MSLVKSAYRIVVGGVAQNPTATAGLLVFGLGFTLVAGNAIYSQPQVHPDPFWQTTDKTVTRSLVETVEVKQQPVSITRSVLTQTISLKNIPVPTAKPSRRLDVATQSELVREVQQVLSEIGLYEGKVDGISGSGTKDAVIAYQRSAGLLPDGNISYELLAGIRSTRNASRKVEAIQPLPAPKPVTENVEIQQTATVDFDRQMVKRIQTGLKEKFGETNIDVDGIFGNQTKEALRRFQEFFQITPTGEIDRATLEKLLSAGIIQAI